ncbi:MAG: methyl-accepting chemotaxis protein [Spirochaetota bacterium]|jgi:methyl-accepting chemotaxis protein
MSELLKNMNLKIKLILAFLIVAVLILILGIVSIIQIKSLSGNIEVLGNESIPSILNLEIVKVSQLEIKAAIRSAINPYISKDDLERQYQNIERARENYKKALDNYDIIKRTSEEDKLYKEFLGKLEESKTENNKMIEDLKKLTTIQNQLQKEYLCEQLTQNAFTGKNRKAFDDSMDSLQKLLEYVKGYYGKQLVDKAISTANIVNIVMVIIIIISFGISLILGYVLANTITKPILQTSNNLSISSDNLEKAANQVASASQELSSGASELASSVEEITSSMEELQSIIEANTKNVNEAEILMKETMQTAKGAQDHSIELQKIMNTIGESSKKIIKINKAIDDIAFQTNILALNAAVEAARAGDVGRGFAVVAEQVKSLAQKSADSAKETSDLIDMINQDIENGASKTEIVVTSFNDVVSRAEKVNVLLDEITRASKEQAKGSNQVTKAISQVNSVVQQLAASSEETASSSEEMLSQVESQREAVMELNTVVMGEKAVKNTVSKNTNEKKNDIASKAHRVHASIDAIKAKTKESDNDVELIKPEDKIPLNDFKDF